MPRYINQCVNHANESDILKIYTFKNKIEVLFRTADKEGKCKTYSGQEVVTFLNRVTDIRNHENKFIISENVIKGIRTDVENVGRKNGKYVYKTSNLPLNNQQKESRKYKQAVQCKLNYNISSNVSHIQQLKERFMEILGFDPNYGLCQSLNYFIVLAGLSSEGDFSMLQELANTVTEQDFADYLKGKKEQTYQLFIMLVLLQCLPALSIYGIEKREKFFLPANAILYERLSDFYVWMNQAVIDHEKLRYTLETAKTERYVELELACVAYSADSNNNNSFTHSFLIYKAQNGRYIFFDSNVGATGFCCDKGTADFTLEEVCEAIELSATFYTPTMD